MNDRAVFFDKDGTLVEDVPYNTDPSLVRFAPGAAEAASALHRAGYLLYVVSNQAGVARGHFPEEALRGVERRLHEFFESAGAGLEEFLYCPHDPAGTVQAYAVDCACRKPKPGLLKAAAQRRGLATQDCWVIGDILDDVEAGRRAGMRTILVDNGHETVWQLNGLRRPHRVASDLEEAARAILAPDEYRERRHVLALPASARA